jgi:hypothetical protein
MALRAFDLPATLRRYICSRYVSDIEILLMLIPFFDSDMLGLLGQRRLQSEERELSH